MERTKLLLQFYDKEISQEEFLRSYFDGEMDDEKILAQLQTSFERKDAGTLEEALVVLTMLSNSNKLFSNSLCALLDQPWHYEHEGIAMILKGIRDSSTVDSLFQNTENKFAYLEYDDTFQFARKCIKALSNIGDDNAIEKLKLLTQSQNIVIREYAKKELSRL